MSDMFNGATRFNQATVCVDFCAAGAEVGFHLTQYAAPADRRRLSHPDVRSCRDPRLLAVSAISHKVASASFLQISFKSLPHSSTLRSSAVTTPRTRLNTDNTDSHSMLRHAVSRRTSTSTSTGGAGPSRQSVSRSATRRSTDRVVCASQSSLADDIRTKNKANPCIVYSKTYCPYCSDVKDLFEKQLKIDAKIIELDTLADGEDVQAALMEVSGMRTVPQVFVGGELIGGCDDTLASFRSGTLETMLKNAGALKG